MVADDIDPDTAPTLSDAVTEDRAAQQPTAQWDRGPNSVEHVLEPVGDLTFLERYGEDKLLGQGGMGAVWLYADRQIGRRVAMKVLHPEHAARDVARMRFVREARVQGQLEHPSVVPVYDLGVDPKGAHYFTMKRVKGVTLEAIVARLAGGDAEAAERYSRRRLLNAFSNVCLAVQFAHERGVLHRDLKPGNIMLGDFGEVYVLDWGIAKVHGSHDSVGEEPLLDVHTPPDAMTRPGSVLGTPGYMAPEQYRGQHDVGPAADLYALGAILFELLTHLELHPRTSIEAVLAATLMGTEARPSVRAPESAVPPELERLIVSATSVPVAERPPSARAMHESIERYLEGERDVAARRSLAEVAAIGASDATTAVLEAGGSIDERRRAMRAIGHALALDPDNERAIVAMTELLTTPLDELPPEVEFELERADARRNQTIGRVGGFAYLGMFAFLPLLFWLGVRDVFVVSVFFSLAVLCSGLSFFSSRKRSRPTRWVLATMVASQVCFMMATFIVGPFLVMPAVLAINTAAYCVYLDRAHRPWVVLVGVLCMVGPIAFEVLGITPAAYVFTDAGMLVVPNTLDLPRVPTLVFLSVASVASIVLGAFAVSRIRDQLADAERHLYTYAWHLREFVPEASRAATDPTGRRREEMDREKRSRRSRPT